MTVCAGMFWSNLCCLTLSSRKTVALHYFQSFFLKKKLQNKNNLQSSYAPPETATYNILSS